MEWLPDQYWKYKQTAMQKNGDKATKYIGSYFTLANVSTIAMNKRHHSWSNAAKYSVQIQEQSRKTTQSTNV